MEVMTEQNEPRFLNCMFRKRGEIVAREIAGETLLVPVRGNLADMQRIFSLDPVGDFIWKQLDGEKDLEALLASITDNFEIERDVACADLLEFVQQLKAAGLIEEISS